MNAISIAKEAPLIGGFELMHRTKGKRGAGADVVDKGGGIYPLAVLTVARGDLVRMAMTLVNNTGASVTRDLLSLYGTHDVARGEFIFDFGCVREDVSIGTGTTTHNVDCRAAVAGTLFDGYAGVGSWVAGTFTAEHSFIRADVLTVTGVTVTGFTLARA